MNIEAYKIFTKDDYMRYMLSGVKACSIDSEFIKHINEMWDRISNGNNFLIAVGREDNLMFYSVDGFNDILGNSNGNI
jgi:hypothetical protein